MRWSRFHSPHHSVRLAGELIAVKELTYPATTPSTGADDRIRLEIETMKALKHDNIVRYMGATATRDTVYLLMEYVPGKSRSEGRLSLGALIYY